MTITRKPVTILKVGTAIVSMQSIKVEQIGGKDSQGNPAAGNMETHNPDFGYGEEPGMYQSPFGLYGSATSIDQLNEVVSENYPNLPWELFELMATFPDTYRISLMVGHSGVYSVALVGNKETALAWWIRGEDRIYCATSANALQINRAPLQPSELLYGFSIAMQHLVMGSPSFSIGRTPDDANVDVRYIDPETMNVNPAMAVITFRFPSYTQPAQS